MMAFNDSHGLDIWVGLNLMMAQPGLFLICVVLGFVLRIKAL